MKNFINHIFQIQFQQFLRLSFMVTCQSSELDWEVTVELPADFLSLGRGSVTWTRILSGAKHHDCSPEIPHEYRPVCRR